MRSKKSSVSLLLVISFLLYVILEYKNGIPYFVMVNMIPSKIEQQVAFMNHSVAAFYTCYKQVASANKVLSYFRKQYPTAPIHLFNDAGDPLIKYVSYKHGAKYTYQPNHTASIWIGNNFDSAENAWVYVKNLLVTARLSNSDWIVLLEDDVVFLRQITVQDLEFDMNGVKPDWDVINGVNEFWYTVVQKYMKDHYPNVTLHTFWSGSGGTVFRGSFLRSIDFSKARMQLDNLFELAKNQKIPLASDQILSFVVQINGGSIGTNRHFTDAKWPISIPKYLLGYVDILHGDKSLYSK